MKRVLLCIRLYVGVLLILLPGVIVAQSLTIKAVESKDSRLDNALDAKLRSWTLYQLAVPLEEPSRATQRIMLQLGKRQVLLSGVHHPLTGDDSRLVALYQTGGTVMKFPNLLYFKSDRGRLTVGKGFILGEFQEDSSTYIIESMVNLVPGAEPSLLVVYQPADVIVDNARVCALKEGAVEVPAKASRESASHNAVRTTGPCREVEIAVLTNSESFHKHGSNLEQTAAYISSIYFLSEGDFTGQLNDDLKFKINEMIISTSENTDPWEWFLDPELDINLGLFSSWARDGFQSPNDLSSYWFNDGLRGGYIGVGELGQTCHLNGDAVIREQDGGAQLMRCLLSHEHGHNFNALHDVGGGKFIMAPVIKSGAKEFSEASRAAINAHLAAPATKCITPCPSAACENIGPQNLSVRYDSAVRSIQCSWSAETGINGFVVRWRIVGDSIVHSATTAATDTVFHIPVPAGPSCQAYRVQVARICSTGGTGVFTGGIDVTIGSLPLPIISVSNDTLYSSVASGNQWYFRNQAILGATGSSHKPLATGSYSVQTRENGCQSLMSNPYFFYLNWAHDRTLGSRFTFAPNPVADYLKIWYPGTRVPFTLMVYDLSGRKLLNQHLSASTVQVDMRKFSAGIYLVQVVIDYSGFQIKKMILKQ